MQFSMLSGLIQSFLKVIVTDIQSGSFLVIARGLCDPCIQQGMKNNC